MTTQHKTLVYHTFQGGRFEDHGVDLDVLEDLVRYRTILVEVAKELWRRNHPDRERLPRNFEESLALKFYEVQSNCATIPLERLIRTGESQSLFAGEEGFNDEDELDQAVDLVTRTVQAAGLQQAIPEDFPKNLLGLFEKYGSTLRSDEWIEQRPSKATQPVRYDSAIRERLANAMNASYEASAEITGYVTMARVSRPRMAIQLDDEREVEAAFLPSDEDKITTALKEHAVTKVKISGRGQFAPDGRLLRITLVDKVDLLPGGELPFDATARPIWEEFEEILAGVPQEELEKIPVDAAEKLDHYLYGSPGN